MEQTIKDLPTRAQQLQFVTNLVTIQQNIENEGAAMKKEWKEIHSLWSDQKQALQTEIDELRQLSSDERLCFVQEMQRLATEKADLEETVRVTSLHSEELFLLVQHQQEDLQQARDDHYELELKHELLETNMSEHIQERLSQHELVWQHERTRFLDKVWQLEMEVADLRTTSKTRGLTVEVESVSLQNIPSKIVGLRSVDLNESTGVVPAPNFAGGSLYNYTVNPSEPRTLQIGTSDYSIINLSSGSIVFDKPTTQSVDAVTR